MPDISANVKSRSKKEMKEPKAITMRNGKPATQGTCPSCGIKMFRIGKSCSPYFKVSSLSI
jgi:hypothetical protein